MRPFVVVSIGYERRSVEEFIDTLQLYGVEKLLDVRELPLSRRKGFCKTALASRLDDAGIEYQHLPAAGNPHRHLREHPAECLALYRAHLLQNPEVMDEVSDELEDGPVAMLCYERRHTDCHRSVLLDALLAEGHRLKVVRVE